MDGVLIIDKPSGWTSNDVVQKVKHLLGAKKVGHGGTLDPLATGLLPLCLNRATKCAGELLSLSKEYEACFKLGIATDTEDADGREVDRCEIPTHYDLKVLRESLEPFCGAIEQRVPAYSAVKWKGVPLYRWARKGLLVPRPIRTVEVSSLELSSCDWPLLSFRIVCSKGTYVRTLLTDWAESLGWKGHLVGLRRTRLGTFEVRSAATLEEVAKGKFQKAWFPMEDLS